MNVLVLLVFLGGLGVTLAIGSCDNCPDPMEGFDFDQFATDNHGVWGYKMVPAVDDYANLTWVFQTYDPLAAQGVYWARVYQRRKGKGPSLWNSFIRFELDGGTVIGKPFYDGDFCLFYRFTFLAYEVGRFAYFHVCCDEGDGNDIDHRFVLGHGELTEEDLAKIGRIDEECQLEGTLQHIS